MTATSAQDDLAAMVQVVQRACRGCVVVAGSWGTGEATVDPVSGRRLSDVELAVVGGLRTYLRLRAARRRGVGGTDVELYWVSPGRLRRGRQRNLGPARPSVSAYDLVRQPRLGELPRRAQPARVWAAADLGRREAVSLLANRVGELLEAGTPYALVKVAVSAGDALLVTAGRYELGYDERARRFEDLTPGLPSRLVDVVRAGYAAKLGRSAVDLDRDDVRAAVAAALTTLLQVDDVRTADIRLAIAAAWNEEHPRPLDRAVERVSQTLRAARVLPVRTACAALWRRPGADVVAYADLLGQYLGTRGEPAPGAAVVRCWKAYCY